MARVAGTRGAGKSALRRPQLSDAVADHVRHMILSGEVRPGEFIRMDQVAEELGVSVTPVREGLAALRGQDMVDLEPSRGYVVAPLSRQDVEDVFRLQANLAGDLAARAADRISPEELDEIEEIQRELAEAIQKSDTERVEKWEFRFHRAINIVADSRKLSWFLKSATGYLPQHFYSADPEWRESVISDHAAILTGLRSGDRDAVRDAMVQHVIAGGERLVAYLESSGMWSDRAQ